MTTGCGPGPGGMNSRAMCPSGGALPTSLVSPADPPSAFQSRAVVPEAKKRLSSLPDATTCPPTSASNDTESGDAFFFTKMLGLLVWFSARCMDQKGPAGENPE